jgi:hypothetical protein
MPHDLDCDDIDDLDEISGDQQLAFVWCHTHKRYEWHMIDRAEIAQSQRRQKIYRAML